MSYSQETIQITVGQAKEAIKTKHRVEKLESALRVQGLIVSELKLQVSDLKEVRDLQASEINLWENNYNLLNTQYEAEKAKKPKDNTFIWILRSIGAFGIGYFVGSVM